MNKQSDNERVIFYGIFNTSQAIFVKSSQRVLRSEPSASQNVT